MLKQKYRKECLSAIHRYYPNQEADLMADRLAQYGNVYYSVWHIEEALLEVTDNLRGEINIYQYVAA